MISLDVKDYTIPKEANNANLELSRQKKQINPTNKKYENSNANVLAMELCVSFSLLSLLQCLLCVCEDV